MVLCLKSHPRLIFSFPCVASLTPLLFTTGIDFLINHLYNPHHSVHFWDTHLNTEVLGLKDLIKLTEIGNVDSNPLTPFILNSKEHLSLIYFLFMETYYQLLEFEVKGKQAKLSKVAWSKFKENR